MYLYIYLYPRVLFSNTTFPPFPLRFECVYFEFGSDTLTALSSSLLHPASLLLLRHSTLRIRVEGRAQPDAPEYIQAILSSRRAHAAAGAIWAQYRGSPLAPANLGVLAGPPPSRIEVVGAGSRPLVNTNFARSGAFKRMEEKLLEGERTAENYGAWAQLWRRVDISIVGLY